jgi:peptide/nickel transport system permease protein/oligopeptide transport system permease protein
VTSGAYLIRRVVLVLPVLVSISLVVFGALRLVPGDPARLLAGTDASEQDVVNLRARYGLDQPAPVQYASWLERVVTGDLGISIKSGRPVLSEIASRYGNTFILATISALVAVLVGVPAGVLAASRRARLADHLTMALALFGVCIPGFWLGLMLQLLLSVQLGWLPTTGAGSWQHLLAPSLTLAAFAVANFARVTRGSVLEVLDLDYIRTARAKGVPERLVLTAHALRNALLPVVTVVGVEFGQLMAGAVVVETVFAYPGIGRYLIDSILSRDYPAVQATVLVIASSWVVVNLGVDLLYGVLDPRVATAR